MLTFDFKKLVATLGLAAALALGFASPAIAAVCGNNQCDAGDCDECSSECDPSYCAQCGFNGCEPGETKASCSADCCVFPADECNPDCGTIDECACNGVNCPVVCGDDVCDTSETCSGCPADCGDCPPECGDDVCNGTETCDSCSADCGDCLPECGDGTCDDVWGEDCDSCAEDCGDCSSCGDGTCDPGEDDTSDCPNYCTADCGTLPSSESACSDTLDDDCDGSADCADTDCDNYPSCMGTETVCDNDVDDDGDGDTDCADVDDCSSDPACNGAYGCTDPCADNYDSNATDDDGSCTFGLSNDESGCCTDGHDNDGDDGQQGGGIDGTDTECMETCADRCATNYAPQGGGTFCTDTDGDGMDDCCTIPDEANGYQECCHDNQDNDHDGPFDWCNDANGDGDCNDLVADPNDPTGAGPDEPGDTECTGGGGGGVDCDYSGSYTSAAACGGVATLFAGDSTYTLYDQDVCPADADAALAAGTASALASKGGVCGYEVGDSYSVGGSSDSFYFEMTLRDECPYDPWTTVPPGYEQTADGHCVPSDCVAVGGDSDGDTICDQYDPCDNIADADLGDGYCAGLPCSRLYERDQAGLIAAAGGSCVCGEFARDAEVGSAPGEDIGGLQDFLANGGFLDAAFSGRGTFGIATRDALAGYQVSVGISTTSGLFDSITRAYVNGVISGPRANKGDYSAGDYDEAANICPPISVDLCENINGEQSQAWLDGHSELTRDASGDCLCADDGELADCPAGPTDYCTLPGECCSPSDFWYCDEANPPACIANEECCGGCCGLEGQELTCCENPTASGCTPPVCTGLTGQALTCCQNPNDSACGGCRSSGYSYCSTLRSCVQNAADCPIEGCYPTSGTLPDPYAQVASYCAVIASETDANGDGYGDFYRPWRVGVEYSTLGALDALFGQLCNAGVNVGIGSCPVGDLTRILAEQDDARTDPSAALTAVYPVYGTVTRAAYGAICTADPCEHGEECALYVGAGGKTMATCVPAVCDPCNEELPACPEGVTPSASQCCYDLATCECDPLLDVGCCENGDEGCSTHGVSIEASPNLVPPNGECLLVWASQGMASVTVSGRGVDSDLASHFAGSDEVQPGVTSGIYRIVGLGTDGETYEATDICATGVSTTEL